MREGRGKKDLRREMTRGRRVTNDAQKKDTCQTGREEREDVKKKEKKNKQVPCALLDVRLNMRREKKRE